MENECIHIQYIENVPKGWFNSSFLQMQGKSQRLLSTVQNTHPDILKQPFKERLARLQSLAQEQGKNEWLSLTDIPAEQSEFTIIVPIHNEGESLKASLSALYFADIPFSGNVNIVFITNGCTPEDTGKQIITTFMQLYGEIAANEISNILPDYNDPLLSQDYTQVRRGNSNIIHINTETPGKANAINIGNSIALASGHLIAMNIDADFFVEPETIPRLYKSAYQQMIVEQNSTAVISGVAQFEQKPQKTIKDSLRRTIWREAEDFIRDPDSVVQGCLMAWNPQWLQDIGGMPQVIHDDYALGVLAKNENKLIARALDAKGWLHTENNITKIRDMFKRFVKGAQQLIDYYPDVQKIVEKDLSYMRDTEGRIQNLLTKSIEKPQYIPLYIATYLFWEQIIHEAKQEYQHHPSVTSWKT